MLNTEHIYHLLDQGLEMLDRPLEGSELYGDKGQLNSVELVTLIAHIEDELATQWQVQVSLVDEKAFSHRFSPFRDKESFVQFIEKRIQDERAAN